ncbi:ribokinase [Curtobacterium flaccumfaciens]|uniref:PfkB family carbohydrate kinase n=1 Tax=Curtobacterium flaccumfaciens TaxID=2035 RepID=UPI00188DAD83|nr:PfkB family carbohydrate kinase [Curtobacterium flaccumfaciens]MBF4595726.1 ribokinase [Curtobacterium flaccumfaciens]
MSALSAVDLTVVGSLNFDVTARAAALPAPGETIGGGTLAHSPGGKGANQAAAAARLGATVRMIGAIGDDEAGISLSAALRDAGVDIGSIAITRESTGTALIVIDTAGENQIVVCPGANDAIAIDPDTIRSAPAILLQFEIPPAVVEEICRTAEGFLAINAAPAREMPTWMVERADLIVVNDSEAAAQPGVRAAKRLVITHGGDGASFYRDGELAVHVPAVRATVRNTVGAGDAFCAALTCGLLAGIDSRVALEAAAAIGAAAVEDTRSQPLFDRWEQYSIAAPRTPAPYPAG